jgi:hypothetical protein
MISQTRGKLAIWLDTLIIPAGIVLFLIGLPFHLVVKKLIPGPAGTYWKEILLGLLVVLWAIRRLQERQAVLSGNAPLDRAVLVYVGLLVLRFVLDRSGWTGAWGLYVSVMYLPLFWLVPTVMRWRAGWLNVLLALLIGVGGVVALGGLVEFVLDVSLWPSDVMVQRQGFPDVFIYGTHIRRVYFTFDSPTTLANTLAMLLPLALVSVLVARRTWARVAAGAAAALMAACIIVTFSRGIWVATALSLLGMGLLSGFVQRNLRVLAVAAGALALIGLAWGVVAASRRIQAAVVEQYTVELAPDAYAAVPIASASETLLQADPIRGEAVVQTWVLLDPISGMDDERLVLYKHPPKTGRVDVVYRVAVPEAGALRFAIALAPQVWSPEKGDGTSFEIYVADPEMPQQDQFVFIRHINPKHNPSDRRWRNFLVDLSPWAGHTVDLSLVTESGPAGDWAFDWAGWAELEVVSVEPGYFASTQEENAVLRHTGSVLDWVRDETNRDRLAAWSLGLAAWRGSPLWGNGLGSTGEAALRTNPEQAFVTESQVLKVLAELGLPGLLVWAYLWFQIASAGYQTYRKTGDLGSRMLLLGVLTGLLVVFLEGWVYQNLEVKQVNAYFWTLVGSLAFLAGDERPDVPL